MLKRSEVYEDPVTGERAVVRVGTAETKGARLVVDVHLRPGARVPAPHDHPTIHERFTVVRGQVGFTLGRRQDVAEPGQSLEVSPGVVHESLGISRKQREVETQSVSDIRTEILLTPSMAQIGNIESTLLKRRRDDAAADDQS